EILCLAISALDPCFDGLVSLPVLSRALKALRKNSDVAAAAGSARLFLGRQDAAMRRTYGEVASVDVVRLEFQAESIFKFDRSFAKFRDQQRELLDQHLRLAGPRLMQSV
ncbi:unnamed protein product, partial [Polarella glacialis]